MGGLLQWDQFSFGTFVTLIICTLFASLMSSIVFYGPFSIVQRAMDSRQVIYLLCCLRSRTIILTGFMGHKEGKILIVWILAFSLRSIQLIFYNNT